MGRSEMKPRFNNMADVDARLGEMGLTRHVYEWNPPPCPKKGPFVTRRVGSPHMLLHNDNWLVEGIYGENYEWAIEPVVTQILKA